MSLHVQKSACAKESLRSSTIATIDEVLLQKLEDQDLVVKEAHYHYHCRGKCTIVQSQNVLQEDAL